MGAVVPERQLSLRFVPGPFLLGGSCRAPGRVSALLRGSGAAFIKWGFKILWPAGTVPSYDRERMWVFVKKNKQKNNATSFFFFVCFPLRASCKKHCVLASDRTWAAVAEVLLVESRLREG